MCTRRYWSAWKAYNTKLDGTTLENDLQDIEPKAYQKSEMPAKERNLMKNKTMREKANKIEVDGGS